MMLFIWYDDNKGCFAIVIQVSKCHPNHVPTHSAIPYNCSHHQQRRKKTKTGSQGPGQSHSTGNC